MDTVIQWLGWTLAVLFGGTLLLKGEIKFDVNEWLRDRRKHKEENIRLLCPHVQGFTQNGKQGLRSTYISPAGATYWECQQCGRITHDWDEVRENLERWVNNPEAYLERIKRQNKLGENFRR